MVLNVKQIIEFMANLHNGVDVIFEAGNHDPISSHMLGVAFDVLWSERTDVNIHPVGDKFHYHRYGKNLIGVHHGDTVKPAQLPAIMAHDRSGDWGATTHRLWLTGHKHTDRVLDTPGCRVESIRALTPTDSWSNGQGYRSEQDMRALHFHPEYGEVARYRATPEMLGWCKSS